MPQLLTLDTILTPEPKNTLDDTLEPVSTNQITDKITETQEL